MSKRTDNRILKRYLCITFIAALFTIAKVWRQPKCQLIFEWIKKMWYKTQENQLPQLADPACPHQAIPYPGTSWVPALPTSRPTQALGHARPHIQLCQEPAPPNPPAPQLSDTSSGIPGPFSQIPGCGSTCQYSSTNPRNRLHPPVVGATAPESSGPWCHTPVSQH